MIVFPAAIKFLRTRNKKHGKYYDRLLQLNLKYELEGI